jgi:protein transport protein SEC61 subunit alpha
MLYRNFKGNFLVSIIGKWQEYDLEGHSAPVGGIAYYISPPRFWIDIVQDPFHFVFYSFFVIASCAFYSRLWIDISGTAPRDIVRQLTE